MSEPVTHKLDYSELERIYKEASERQPRCSHAGASRIVDALGWYIFRCSQCDTWGYADEKAARRMGWIE